MSGDRRGPLIGRPNEEAPPREAALRNFMNNQQGVAARRGGHGGAEPDATLDAARRDRLAHAAADVAAGVGRLNLSENRLRQSDSTVGLADPKGCGSDPLRAC